ncbi:MAG: hypothetical protein WD135_07080 [Ferruginibacter sp.]
MKKTILLSLVFATFLLKSVSAQSNTNSFDYKTALGVKFYPGAITFKHFLTDKNAVEILGYFWNRGSRITGLYEIHGDIEGASGLKWYIGPGAHIAFYNSKYYDGKSFFGLDGVIGLDYKIKTAPINLSIDWQPSFEFGDGAGFSGNWGGFAVRYVF